MNEVIVTTGVPVPQAKKQPKYPFAAMEIGSSFFLEGKNSSQASSVASAGHLATGFSFAVRGNLDGEPWGKTGVKGAAIWRVEPKKTA